MPGTPRSANIRSTMDLLVSAALLVRDCPGGGVGRLMELLVSAAYLVWGSSRVSWRWDRCGGPDSRPAHEGGSRGGHGLCGNTVLTENGVGSGRSRGVHDCLVV